MSDTAPLRESQSLTLPLRVADLPNRQGVDFRLSPDTEARAALAAQLDLPKLRKLTFSGTLRPEGHHDWRLEGVLGATAVQSCVVTSDPVTTRIDTPVLRRFLRRMPEIDEPEVEIPDDDSIEPLGPVIDPGAVMAEALTLALPDYPRAPGADLADLSGIVDSVDAPPAERQTPFADLSALIQGKDER